MSKKEFRKYFPLKSYGLLAPVAVTGAYERLIKRGYGCQVSMITEQPSYLTLKPAKTHDYRVMVTGLLHERDADYLKRTGVGLLDEFFDKWWTEEHSPLAHRKKQMLKWYCEYVRDYKDLYHGLIA